MNFPLNTRKSAKERPEKWGYKCGGFSVFSGKKPMTNMVDDLLCKDECYQILGACFAVYEEMGCGFLEPVYQECLTLEFANRHIPADAQFDLPLLYRGRALAQRDKADFVCHGKIIVEIKAVSQLVDAHRAQVLNYLSATGYELGLLVNFGHYPKVEYQRIVRSKFVS